MKTGLTLPLDIQIKVNNEPIPKLYHFIVAVKLQGSVLNFL